MLLLHFRAFLLHFHAPSYAFVIFPLHSCYISSTTTVIMSPCLCYTAGHSRPSAPYSLVLSVVCITHQQAQPFQAIQDYLRALRAAGRVVNTAIVMAAAEGILSARCPGRLQKQGEDIQITKDWAKSLMSCI